MARVRLLMTSLSFFTVVAAAHKAEAQGFRQVNVTIPALTESLVAFYLGIEKGYLREKGLDVELIMVDPSGGDTRRNRQPRAAAGIFGPSSEQDGIQRRADAAASS